MEIDLTGIAAAAVTGIFGILGAVLLAIIQAKIKNQQMAELLSAAVKNSLGKMQQATVGQLSNVALLHPTIPAAIAPGVQYVVDHAPEALTHFGITPEAVADKIEAQIGLAEIATNLAVTASPAPIIAAPLGPVPVDAGNELPASV